MTRPRKHPYPTQAEVRAAFYTVDGELFRHSNRKRAGHCLASGQRAILFGYAQYRYEDILAIYNGEPIPPHRLKDGSGRFSEPKKEI